VETHGEIAYPCVIHVELLRYKSNAVRMLFLTVTLLFFASVSSVFARTKQDPPGVDRAAVHSGIESTTVAHVRD
jgi:hypothetical protein